ncbi:MAG: sulfite exporter TauE/SafE family protein [Verrucomicrobiota bacterium]
MIEVTTTAGALVAGIVTSTHCAAMCGPLACTLLPNTNSPSNPLTTATLYHTGRLLAYSVIGAIAGAIGHIPLNFATQTPIALLPWVLALALLLVGFGLEKNLPQPAFIRRWTAQLRLKACRLSAKKGAFAVGLATPLLPCAPLYLMFGVALVSGSALQGAEFTLAFALGTIPLLWLAQQQFTRLQPRLRPATLTQLRRGLALVTAFILIARLAPNLPFLDGNATTTCPLCL